VLRSNSLFFELHHSVRLFFDRLFKIFHLMKLCSEQNRFLQIRRLWPCRKRRP
jgi:hypothetical protein